MNSFFSNVVRGKDGFLYGKPRKKYERKHPYPEHVLRIKPLPREKSAIVILRRKGYRINMLSKIFGRSTSFIHRVLKRNISFGVLKPMDMRKMPDKTRKYYSKIRWNMLLKCWEKWEAWIFGEGEEPP
jgi:hypothetical protein